MSLVGKIVTAFAVLVLSIGVIGGFGVYEIQQQNIGMVKMVDVWFPSVSKVGEITQNISKFRMLQAEYLLEADPEKRAKISDKFDEISGNLFIYFKVIDPLMQTDEQKKKLESVMSQWDSYVTKHDGLLKAYKEGDLPKAQLALVDSQALFGEIGVGLQAMADEFFSGGVKTSEFAAADYKLARIILWSAIGALSIIGMGVSFLTVRMVSKHCHALVDNVSATAVRIKKSSEELATASRESADSSTVAAASLEETAAALEEITTMVTNNSESTKVAMDKSQATRVSVQNGRKIVGDLIDSMKQVSASSAKISDIIKIIDDISFQTNLLALNAAVEAARAGEHGKGFAVVADAVRSLAQKSTESAKQIGDLIEESGLIVEKASKAVAQSDGSFQDIVKSVEDLSQILSEITKSSEEQAKGIGLINTTMNQIDDSTQKQAHSSKLIFESSSALLEESEQLERVLEPFKKQDKSKFSQAEPEKDSALPEIGEPSAA